ncbi:hypothetical protein BDQ17DRAFT_1430450 [Cyathus striatus]|nr:hypothetical protein BDQ17DRAFT_1430450 [Cyathus striatus]
MSVDSDDLDFDPNTYSPIPPTQYTIQQPYPKIPIPQTLTIIPKAGHDNGRKLRLPTPFNFDTLSEDDFLSDLRYKTLLNTIYNCDEEPYNLLTPSYLLFSQ